MIDPLKLDIVVREFAGIERCKEPIRIGLPVPQGTLNSEEPLAIFSPDGKLHPCQTRPLKYWPDGSVKWLLVDFLVSVQGDSAATWKLLRSIEPLFFKKSIHIQQSDDDWIIDTGAGVFYLDSHILRPFKQVIRSSDEVCVSNGISCLLSLKETRDLIPLIDEITVEDDGPLHAIIRVTGHFNGSGLRYQCRIHFVAETLQVRVVMTLHNPQAAHHPQGLWDLGDEGSILFRDLTFSFAFPEGIKRRVCCYSQSDGEPIMSDGAALDIYQESSGGVNWQSPNHRNQDGTVALTFNGYKVFKDDVEVYSGLRATPLVWSGAGHQGVAAVLPLFWQEFPKQITASQEELQISLFPSRFPELHELQGGEKKTHEFYLDFATEQTGLRWTLSPLTACASADSYRKSGIFGDLPDGNDLVDQFITAADIFNKREIIDEYGWRNFGEVYADHEAVNHKESSPFVSHYNNQYDVIAGAYRKAFATENFDWLELAADLAKHVQDVDIYHTEEDREEYNYGLFWHTDHYSEAGLSTHRSYSREQKATYELYTGGGGPGAEHCYTTGLTIHYFLTGNPDFKKAAIDLAHWELLSLNGPQTILAATKRFVDNLKLWRYSKGQRRLFPTYPLTRGTGNAVTTCLDAFEVTNDQCWLEKVAAIISRTLSPHDDIELRDLLNAEVCWSYTVFLVALIKYLDKKVELDQFDSSFHHARLSLLHYTLWMVDNEYPYLDKPEILEYPNETWAAQDLRKSVIFYHAARYSSDSDQQHMFIERAIFFYDYAEAELKTRTNNHFTRPIALMLQNSWVGTRLKETGAMKLFTPSQINPSEIEIPYLGLNSTINRFAWELKQVIGKTSLKNEINWLKSRI